MNEPRYTPGHHLLHDRTAVVTAAAGAGIGGATARRFLEEGARVVIGDAHVRRLKETEQALAAEFGAARISSLPCDVTDEDQVQALFAHAEQTHGRLDIVVNNAGLGGTAALADMTDAQWSRVLDVTLNGTFRCTRAALRSFRDSAPEASSSTTPPSSAGAPRPARPTTPPPRPGSWPSPAAPPWRPRSSAYASTPSPPAWPCTRTW